MTCDGIAGGIGAAQGGAFTAGISNNEDEEPKKKFVSMDQALADNSAFVAWGHATQSVDNSNTGGGYYS